MKTALEKMSAYNKWANLRLVDYMLSLPEASWLEPVPSSFGSLYKTVLHMWDAESIWWQRIRLHQHLVIPSQSFETNMRNACNGLLEQNRLWESFIKEVLSEDALGSELAYQNLQGHHFSQPLQDILLHVFNHGTYHRGQLTIMLHALGANAIPATDLIVYDRG